MIGLLVVTHGPLAQELVAATEKIVGEAPRMEAISLGWEEEQAHARKRIEEAIQRNEQGQGILILTDLFGGTASNLSFAFRSPGAVDVVTGVNLPMVVKFAMVKQESKDLATVAHMITEKGSKAIRVASDLLTTVVGSGVGR